MRVITSSPFAGSPEEPILVAMSPLLSPHFAHMNFQRFKSFSPGSGIAASDRPCAIRPVHYR
jgi:hypothetical protein